MRFQFRAYLPIYEYGDPDNGGAETVYGRTTYSTVQDLFDLEPEAIDYFEVEGEINIPDRKECGAV
jgi:hypothetical protein